MLLVTAAFTPLSTAWAVRNGITLCCLTEAVQVLASTFVVWTSDPWWKVCQKCSIYKTFYSLPVGAALWASSSEIIPESLMSKSHDVIREETAWVCRDICPFRVYKVIALSQPITPSST